MANGNDALTSLRLPTALLRRVDALQRRMRDRPGFRASRANTIRYLIAIGLDQAEAQAGAPQAARKRGSRASK